MEIFLGNAVITLLVLVGSNIVVWNKALTKGINETLEHLEAEGVIEFTEE